MDYQKINIYDIETIKGFFLFSVYNIENDKWEDFCINQYQNDLYKLIKWLDINKDIPQVGFNNLGFDAYVTEFVWRNYSEWYDLTNLQISEKIWQFAQDLIDNQNYNVFLPYRESELSFIQIDIPRIFHWFNENRRVSLKQAEFELRAETIENFEVDHRKVDFTEDEVKSLIHYCHNDCIYTYELFKICIGQTDNILYKGKDKIRDREIIQSEVGLECLNWDDVKIGAEWNKKDFLEISRMDSKKLKPLKTNHFYGKKYKEFFPNTVEFQSKELQDFVKKIGETFILAEKQEFGYSFRPDLKINIARGGIHSCEKYRYIKPDESEVFLQNDIGSQYPNAIRKYKVFPRHLGIAWNQMIDSKIARRLKFKSLYKETKEAKYNSLQEMGKMSLNGGSYGRLNTKGDWQEDPCAMLKVTMGCQLEILMIGEALQLKGFELTSFNTDGWDCIVPKNRLEEYFNIVWYYEELIGNKELGNVEFTEFEWMAQTSVNDYIAKKKGEWVKGTFIPHKMKDIDDNLKQKGDFEYHKELHKNSSFSIFSLALQKYFNEGIDPEKFINNHSDVFDFCARSSSGSTYIHESYDNKGSSVKLPKLIRYYVSRNGNIIKKMVKEDCDTNANDANVRPADKLKSVCNRLTKQEFEYHLDNVDREWYINSVKETIYSVEKGKKPSKNKVIDKNQISLF